MTIIPVILSGGSGSRLWPLSRKEYPKQYLSLTGKNSLLQETILRLRGLTNLADPIIVCNEDHRFVVAEQLKQINIDNSTILLEPVIRNTAPAITAAAIQLAKDNKYKDINLLVLSADHVIDDIKAFHKAINIAAMHSDSGKLVTFGIVPTEANIGYGYIKASIDEQLGAFEVESFVEKPGPKMADKFLKEGNYLWNSGMYMFRSDVIIKELSVCSEEIVDDITKSVNNAKHDLNFIRLDDLSFKSSPSISIEHAVLEKSNNVVTVPLDAGWDDVGGWPSLYDVSAKDDYGNVIKGDVYIEQTSNSFIHSSNRIIATIGINNLVIIDTPDALFVSTKEKTHFVKNIVEKLQKEERSEYNHQRKVYRPWGWYDVIEMGNNFQVKRLHVNQGAKLSLQKHHKRAEHWVIVSGTATAINGDKILTLQEGESTFIPIGVTHSLENQGNLPLEIIEIQSGTYLGEDDIVRFEDIYDRIKE